METITKMDAEATPIKGRQREEKDGNKESGYKGYIGQGPSERGEGRHQKQRMQRLY